MFARKATSYILLRTIGLALLAAVLAGCGPTLQTAVRVMPNPDTTTIGKANQLVPPEEGHVAGFTVNRGSTARV